MLKVNSDAATDEDVQLLELTSMYHPPEQARVRKVADELRDACDAVIHESLRIRR
jgi:hypothetical protein